MIRAGQTFLLDGERFRVAYVNQSRAHCVSEQIRTVTVTDRKTGQARTFEAPVRHTLDISPDTDLALLREVSR